MDLTIQVLVLGGDAAVADQRACSADRVEPVAVEGERCGDVEIAGRGGHAMGL
ncbi:hypothetical protein [Nocardia sp. NBC_00403]|uniref:hypothetical protein n=1 Tax=Nocardia sp. NBC_00403 TaxID=2975990 RepID=UPI002E2494B3